MDVLVVRAQSLKSGEFTVSYTMTVGWQIKSVSSCTESTEMSRRKEVFQKCAVCPQGTRFCLHQAVAELPSPVSATCPSFSTSASAGSSSLPCGRSMTTPSQRTELGFWLNDFGPVFRFHRLLLRSAGAEVEQLPQWWKSFHIDQRRGRWDFSVITSP